MANDKPITDKQIIKLFAIASQNGFKRDEIINKLRNAGYNTAKDIKRDDYIKVRKIFEIE